MKLLTLREHGGHVPALPSWVTEPLRDQFAALLPDCDHDRDRRDEWIRLGIFAHRKRIVLETYDRIVGLILTDIAVDGCITKAPGGVRLRRS
jgi:hypothetical protein